MNVERFNSITGKYEKLKIAVLGDFCLDRYLEIDVSKTETSIETNLPVYNVTRVRSQPGAAGTILNNLVALGVGSIIPIGMVGEDGEGFELLRALAERPGVRLEHITKSPEVRTFTYCKPLLMHPGRAPEELNRFDSKNWATTPFKVQSRLAKSLRELAPQIDALIIMDQVDVAETGVVTNLLLETTAELARLFPKLLVVADSRRGLSGFPSVVFKMNKTELLRMSPASSEEEELTIEEIKTLTRRVSELHQNTVFVTLAERGIVGVSKTGETAYAATLPIRGEIDIVGAGDSVTANLTASLSAGASLQEAGLIAMAAASEVIHQLGTTGTATPDQIAKRLGTD